jgi:hypothetical protein
LIVIATESVTADVSGGIGIARSAGKSPYASLICRIGEIIPEALL